MENPLHLREMGQFPLSIPTSLALESLTNIHPELIHKTSPMGGKQGVTCLWVNLKTLLRNMDNSLGPSSIATVHPSLIAETLLEEMDLIADILTNRSYCENPFQPKHVTFYLCDYAGVEDLHKPAVVRRDNTEKQKAFSDTYRDTMRVLMHLVNGRHDAPWEFLTFPRVLHQRVKQRTAIMTHVAYDLLSYEGFGELFLLESHTGKIKPKTEWYTKYQGYKDLPILPWNKVLLCIFGDSETFRPMDMKIKREVLELAKHDHWSAITTRDRLKMSLGKMKNHYARALVMELF